MYNHGHVTGNNTLMQLSLIQHCVVILIPTVELAGHWPDIFRHIIISTVTHPW